MPFTNLRTVSFASPTILATPRSLRRATRSILNSRSSSVGMYFHRGASVGSRSSPVLWLL